MWYEPIFNMSASEEERRRFCAACASHQRTNLLVRDFLRTFACLYVNHTSQGIEVRDSGDEDGKTRRIIPYAEGIQITIMA